MSASSCGAAAFAAAFASGGAAATVATFGLVFAAGLRRIGYLHHDDLAYLSEILPGPLGRIPRWSIVHMVTRGER